MRELGQNWLLVSVLALGATGACVPGCSSDDGSNPAPSSDASAKSDAPAEVSHSETSTPAESGASVTCGGKSCAPINTPLGNLDACCAADMACGNDITLLQTYLMNDPSKSCLPKGAPGEADSAECPAESIAGVVMLPGCCTPQGHCGYLANDVSGMGINVSLGFGCVDPISIGATPDGGYKTCTYQGEGGTGEAGAEAGTEAGATEAGADSGASDAGAEGSSEDAAGDTASGG